jgi:hypothetical protein
MLLFDYAAPRGRIVRRIQRTRCLPMERQDLLVHRVAIESAGLEQLSWTLYAGNTFANSEPLRVLREATPVGMWMGPLI